MAKKKEGIPIDCKQCTFSDTEAVNHLLPCRNVDRNPKGFKVGDWPKECSHFDKRK